MTTVMGQSVPPESRIELAMIPEDSISGVGIDVIGNESNHELINMVMHGIRQALNSVRETDTYTELARATVPSLQVVSRMNSAILCATKSIDYIATARAFPADILGGIWRGRDKRNNTHWAIVNGLLIPQIENNPSEARVSLWLITQEQKRK